MGRSKDVFREPDIFKPTRWEKPEQHVAGGTGPGSGFLSLAFGFGARQCVGRRIADNEMQLLLFHVSVSERGEGTARPFQLCTSLIEKNWLN